MDVVSHCAFPVAGRVWRPRPGATILTFVCKATLTLAPGKLLVAPEQQPVNEVDRPWSESVTSLYAASDMAPRKLRPDVVLIGNAYAPGGVPVQKVVARLSVGEVDKSIEVWCDRSLQADGSVIEGQRFTTLPLLYERAAGGAGTDNPVGLPPAVDAYGSVLLPNLTFPGARIAPGVPIKPAGFGPIAARWPNRLARLGRHAEEILAENWADKPFPPDLDMTFFNVAPPDQQPSALRNDERVVLENLHPDHPQLVMTLPGIRLRAKVSGPGGEKAAVLVCDTLWIDSSRGICCLTYRGQVLLGSPAEAGWVVVSLDSEGDESPSGRPEALTGTLNDEPPTRPPLRPATPPPLPDRARGRSPNPTLPFMAMGGDGPEGAPQALPFQSKGDSPETSRPPAPRPSDQALPFQSKPDTLRRAETVAPFQASSDLRRDSAVPFRREVPPPAPSSPGPVTPPSGIRAGWPGPPPSAPQSPQHAPPASVLAPPAPVRAPAPLAPPPSDSPWAIAPNVAGPGTIAPVVAAPPQGAPAPGDFRSGGGALLASNAAAGVSETRSAVRAAEPSRPLVIPAARPAPPREPADVLDLVYYDAESLPRIRRVPAWRRILADLEERPLDAEEDDPAAAKEPEHIEDRREILELLLRAPPSDPAALDEAVSRAARDDGRYLPPIVMVSGDLATPFDEVEILKTTLTVITPVAGNDENLRASMEVARELLKLPGLGSSPQVVESLTSRVRDAYSSAKRAVQLPQLDAQIERALVEQRLYQHRKVLGGRRQRALYHPAGSSGDGAPRSGGPAPLCTYLPDAVESKLPLYARFKTRLIARVHLQLDPYEQGLALECLALARLCPSPRREQK